MKFGLIKSKIENVLTESFLNDTFKNQMFVFEELVLKNENIKKLYFLYDELSTNKGLEKSLAEQFINECSVVIENTVKKITKEEINELELWVENVDGKNLYENIDNLTTTNISLIENKIKSRNVILETLQSKSEDEKKINTTLPELVKIGNKTINDFLSSLTESEQLKVKNVISESDEKLQVRFDLLKETIVEKLTDLKESETDKEVLDRINQTINKVQTESYDKLNYLKLKDLEKDL